MFAIYKYELTQFAVSQIEAPIIKCLEVDYQNGNPYLWAIVRTEEDAPKKKLTIYRVGTGWPVNQSFVENAEYINTTVGESEPYVWHWFCGSM